MSQLDHLVVAATTLAEGVAWCEATLGVTPGAGGAHPLMGTHNRLLDLSSGAFPRAYLEIIAIDPGAQPQRAPHLHRWFDLDDPALRHALAHGGPRLVHFVARVPDLRAAVHALAAPPLLIDRGRELHAARDTPTGRLQWRIAVRDDGQRLFYGALPTLIEWGDMHPADGLPDAGLALTHLSVTHPRALALAEAYRAIGLTNVAASAGAPGLVATLRTPRGSVRLESGGA